MTGTTIGPFQILDKLGEGGMGEVYRARDTRLKREVALKVLPASFRADLDRLARLQREAEVLASLDHPHIAQIYGIEESQDGTGVICLVLELVEGPTLADRIDQGPIAFEDALPIARQIAEALEAAHEQGIVHRDLKPANIKLRPDGVVKILDFGLAKAVRAPGGNALEATNSPTMTSPAMVTHAGVILGTAAYMSPEQARGRAADKRSDVWAFGCVLYEMLTGKRAFQGGAISEVLAAILRGEPEWSALPPALPPNAETVLRQCLLKDPGERLPSIAVAGFLLRPPSPTVATGSGAHRPAWARWAPWVVATLAVAVAVTVSFRRSSRADAAGGQSATRLQVNLPDGVELTLGASDILAIAPDGRRVAFVGMQEGLRRIFLRDLDRAEAQALEGTQGATSCFFASDGRSLGFITNAAQVKRASLGDGLVTTVTTGADVLSGAAWSPSDRIVYVHEGALWSVAATGGAATPLTTIDRDRREIAHTSPVALPDGKTILFSVETEDEEGGLPAAIDAVTLATGARKRVVAGATAALYADSTRIVFQRQNDLLAAPFDLERVAVTGQPVRLPERVLTPDMIAVSGSGVLVHPPTSQRVTELVWVSREGLERPAEETARNQVYPRVAPNGQYIAIELLGAPGALQSGLWIQDLGRGTITRLLGTDQGFYPTWTPDSGRLIYVGPRGIRAIALSDGRDTAVPGTRATDFPTSVSPDGTTLAFARFVPDLSADVYVTSLREGSGPKALISTPAYESGARFSPDGKWLAYVSDESGRAEVYVRSASASDRKWPVSTTGGAQPVWGRDGREIFYRNGSALLAVQVSASADGLTLLQPTVLFRRPFMFGSNIGIANYDVAPDGRRFLMLKDKAGSHLEVVLNWPAELATAPKP